MKVIITRKILCLCLVGLFITSVIGIFDITENLGKSEKNGLNPESTTQLVLRDKDDSKQNSERFDKNKNFNLLQEPSKLNLFKKKELFNWQSNLYCKNPNSYKEIDGYPYLNKKNIE